MLAQVGSPRGGGPSTWGLTWAEADHPQIPHPHWAAEDLGQGEWEGTGKGTQRSQSQHMSLPVEGCERASMCVVHETETETPCLAQRALHMKP